jgi:ornithine cyclodeaminase/alanine dehydrogenase-like protein (mu-crystallin family)
VTSSREPILQGAWVGPGTQVNLVGASTAQAGELLDVMKSEAARHIRGEIGEVLNGTVPGARTRTR